MESWWKGNRKNAEWQYYLFLEKMQLWRHLDYSSSHCMLLWWWLVKMQAVACNHRGCVDSHPVKLAYDVQYIYQVHLDLVDHVPVWKNILPVSAVLFFLWAPIAIWLVVLLLWYPYTDCNNYKKIEICCNNVNLLMLWEVNIEF